jgi:hypothetical protein
MDVDELCAIGEEVFGKYGWQMAMARALGVDGSLVRRWKTTGASHMDITPERARQIRALRDEHRKRLSAELRTAPSSPGGGWHRRAMLLMAAVRALDGVLAADGRGRAAAEVSDVLGRVHLRVEIEADGGHWPFALAEGADLEAAEAAVSAALSAPVCG